MTVYTVWTNYEYENDFLAMFTNYEAATEYATRHHGRVYEETVYDTANEAEEAED